MYLPNNPEGLGVVNVNETGMNFYVLATYNFDGESNFTLDLFKRFYDISFNYESSDTSVLGKRFEARECA